MTRQKSNPDHRPVHSNPTRRNRTAYAPYNFVPLPETLVTVDREKLPALDHYEGRSGWFDCELETCSPTYVRGMMKLDQHEKYDPQAERKLTDAEQSKLKEGRAAFYAVDPAQQIEGRAAPAIPGSSLRGMIRALVEIAGYGKLRWVNDAVKVTFRAVAASREDPLAEPYRNVIGQFSRNVLAGYLHQTPGGDWEIQPALKPKQKGWSEQAAYLKVKEARIPSEAITNFHRFDHSKYWPEYFEVNFNAVNEGGKRGTYVRIMQIGDPEDDYQHRGVLVCTGNMIESGKANQSSPRRNHALVLEEDEQAKPLPISRETLLAYRESLTPFQRDELWTEGGLEEGAPVFYVTAKTGKAVAWFGHTPNFRIPSLDKEGKFASIGDFIPDALRRHERSPDLAEAIFGWVEEEKGNLDKDETPRQRAGRVFFSDARFEGSQNGVWYSATHIAPAPLSSPKITTFQHYLAQDKDAGHDPDLRQTLAHYGTPDTEIRGHKLYWHKGDVKIPLADDKVGESQKTRIEPVKAGVRFRFRVHFENLHDHELGALAWALLLPGESDKTYRHKLGMGKPLGMGAVKIKAKLHLIKRRDRYTRFFDASSLANGAAERDATEFIPAFENFVLERIPDKAGGERLTEVNRIRMLLAMLEWREWNTDWAEKTRYLLIEPDNEYKDRPVLPDPLAVSGGKAAAQAANPLFAEDQTGNVVELPAGRSYGYVQTDVAKGKIFFHFSQLARGVKAVRLQQRVSFKVRDGQRGPEAYDVRPAK